VRCNPATRTGLPFGLVTFDLDHFKSINDCAGHAGGDAVLRLVARAASRCCGVATCSAAWAARNSPLPWPGLDRAGTRAVAERLRQALRGVRPGFPLPSGAVTASFGIAASRPGETLSAAAAAGRRCPL
jgi:diguanylate cyclase (GGDEF)-like protein